MIHTLVVKVASRCNLNCTYCYEYNSGDTTWKTKPKQLRPEFAAVLGHRIREYGRATGAGTMAVIAHGGEPLLVGAAGLDAFFTQIREAASPVRVKLGLQTNGVLLNEAFCEVFSKHQVLVGVSLDGSPHQNRRRIDLQGRETWNRTVTAVSLLRESFRHIWGGLLCVIDLDSDPIETIQSLCQFAPPQIDLLQPYVTHDMAGSARREHADKFGRWMTAALEYWLTERRFSSTRIRVFEDALQASITRRPRTDWFGARRVSYLVVETDGTYDVLDTLKVIGADSHSVRSTKRTIESCSIAEAEGAACALLEKTGATKLPTECVGCTWSDVCSAGYLATRHSISNGFDNRSVYCEGIQSLLASASSVMKAYKHRSVDGLVAAGSVEHHE